MFLDIIYRHKVLDLIFRVIISMYYLALDTELANFCPYQ
jgi:hypothetical protein